MSTASALEMTSDRQVNYGLAICLAIACIMFAEWLGGNSRSAHRTPAKSIPLKLEASSDKKVAAYEAAHRALNAALVHPESAKWTTIDLTPFQQTPDADFIVLEVEVENGRGERVLEHWITRLEPRTDRVLGQVCREEAEAIGSTLGNGEQRTF